MTEDTGRETILDAAGRTVFRPRPVRTDPAERPAALASPNAMERYGDWPSLRRDLCAY